MYNITLRQIEIFVETAKSKSLTMAAEKLHITQSAASMSLKEFERALGGPVFDRVGKGLTLNTHGKVLLKQAEKVLADARELTELGLEGSSSPTGKIIIGCSTTIANYLMPERIKEFQDNNPHAEITLRVGNTLDIERCVLLGEVDIGLVEGDIENKDIHEEDWIKDELAAIAPPDHKFAKKREVRLKEFMQEQWIIREKGSGTLSVVEHALAKKGLKFQNAYEIGHTEAIKRAVEAGMGLSWLSRIAVEREAAAGRLVILHAPLQIGRWFRIITYPGRYQSGLFKHTLKWLKNMKK